MYEIVKDLNEKILNLSNNGVYQSLLELFGIFNNAHVELYLVGGCVRDMLLGKEPKDYDLCTNATPDEVISILKDIKADWTEEDAISACIKGECLPDTRYSIIETGLKHGTVTIHDHKFNQFYEITTYRVDGKYKDNRHPTSVTFTLSLEEDLKRRDFTINSFAYDMVNKKLLMLGESYLSDLELGIIRTVRDAEARFHEDALRMLRAIRFSAQLGFSIDKDTYRAISSCGNLIQYVSHERVRDELTKILLSDNPQMIELITTTGLEGWYMWDGWTWVTNMVKCEHQNPYHYTDVFHHTMDVVRRVPKTFELRWAAFFHDIGKPKVKTLKEGTIDHYRYIGHPEVSADIADRMMGILKFSNEQKETIHNFVLYHDYPLSKCSMAKFKKIVNIIGKNKFLDFIKLREADALAHKLAMSTDFAIHAISDVKERYLKIVTNNEPLTLKDLAINGNDLLELGYKGKVVGEILNAVLDKVLDNPKFNEKSGIIDWIKLKYK